MAMLKVLSQKFSLGASNAAGCLSWCFGNGQQTRKPDRNEYEDPNDADSGTGSNTPPPPYPEHTRDDGSEGGRVNEIVLGVEALSSSQHRKDVLDGDSYSRNDTLELRDRRVIPNGQPCSNLAKTDSGKGKRSGKSKLNASVPEKGSDSESRKRSLRDSSHSSVRPDSTSSVSDNAGRQNGSAYAYDDAETSSDSDDEVLRRYHQTMGMQRAPSKHSIRSARSTTSKTSKAASKGASKPGPGESPGDTTDKDMLLSKAEEGQAPTPEENKGEELAATTSTHEYQNNAFAGTEEVSPADHASENISAYGDAASMSIGDVEQDEHLFDVSDLQDREQAIISKCGNLEVSFSYSYERARMSVTVHRAVEIPSKDRGGANNAQIRLLLLPTKKVRHKTKIKPGENPEFNETFSIKVPPEEINNMGVRFRLYGCERMRRERMIGESVIGFASLNQDEETTHMLQLEPRSNLSHGDSNLDVASLSRSDSASSTQSMQHGGMPELLVGLAYNGTTGRLCVEVIKGSNFRNMAMNRAPDTYVKLTLMSPTGQEIARSKTSIRRGQPNPLYKETFMFQVALFQLPEVTLMTSVYNKRSMKRKEMIGWFSLGKNNSGEEELAHWNDMRESKGEQVCRWHVLLES